MALVVVFFGTTSVEDNEWHFVSVTFDRDGEAKIFLDGVLENSNDISGSSGFDMQADWPFRIGEYSGNGLNFNGAIDEVSMYNRVLSEQEINNLFNETPNTNTPSSGCENIFCDGENVGIGTQDTKGYKLAVEGDIIAEEVKVALRTDWPDYVFNPAYEISTLEALEKYISQNRHLPEIPSKADVEANGINLGEMNAKLLQKIEELTLYLIEQNKKIKAQQQRIEALERRLSE